MRLADGGVLVSVDGRKEPVGALLASFAQQRGYPLQSPGPDAPNWGSSPLRWAVPAAAATGVVLIWIVRRRRPRRRQP